jgi:hypothetical protein
MTHTPLDWIIHDPREALFDGPPLVLDTSSLLDSSPLAEHRRSYAVSTRVSKADDIRVRAEGVATVIWNDQREIPTLDLSGAKYFDSWLGDVAIYVTTNVGLWASGAHFAQVSDWRNVVGQTLATYFTTSNRWDLNEGTDWESQLESIASLEMSEERLAPVLSGFDFVYRAGELLFKSCVRYLTWLFDRLSYYAEMLEYAAAFVAAFRRFSKGLAAVVGVFLNERSWYLHHSAHPPEATGEAVKGRFPAMLRACFRPLPL